MRHRFSIRIFGAHFDSGPFLWKNCCQFLATQISLKFKKTESDLEDFEISMNQLFKSKTYQKAAELFKGIQESVSKEQLHYVNTMLGVYTPASRLTIMWVLYKALIRYALYRLKKKKRWGTSLSVTDIQYHRPITKDN